MKEKAGILIVDDNESLSKTMSLVLTRKGFDVSTANDGPEAIERVKERAFDIIFMDVKMSPMDGVETYKRIKMITPETAVIMMTAYAVEDLLQEAVREGACGVLYKPLDMEKVLSVIEEATKGGHGALILVVDDDPSTCATFKNVLVRKGYQVSVAHTGEEGISTVRETAYGIIFIDMKLPTINGLETYLAIREIDRQAVVIMATGYQKEMAELVEEALNNSAYACLYKPLDMEKVLKMIDEILSAKQTRG